MQQRLKKFVAVFISPCLIVLTACMLDQANAETSLDDRWGVSPEKVISSVKNEIRIVESTPIGNPLLEIYKVEVILLTVTGKRFDGTIGLIVVPLDVKGSVRTEDSASLTITLTTSGLSKGERVPTSPLGLEQVIREVKKAVAASGGPDMFISDMKYEMQFAVKVEGDGGIKFMPLTVGGGATKEQIQTIAFYMRQLPQ